MGLTPGEGRVLRVRYVDRALRPLAGAQIGFAIFGDPRGSTLALDSGVTDEEGVASVGVSAGAASCRFQVHADAPGAKGVVFYVEVSEAGFGSLAVTSAYVGTAPTSAFGQVRYYLFADRGCSALDPLGLPEASRERTVEGLAQPVLFKALPLNADHAILVLALDTAQHPRAAGCVDLSHTVLKVNRQLALSVQLVDLPSRAVGRYALVSSFRLPDPPDPGAQPLLAALHPWADLADCPDDPAQLLLDCILDALDGSGPVDCVITAPSSKALAILAARGTLTASCRKPETDQGTPSLDHELRKIMEAAGPSLLAALAPVATEGIAALRAFEVQSTLELLAQDATGNVVFNHRLDAFVFTGRQDQLLLKTADLGLPQPLASPIAGSVAGWRLVLGQHGFSLRYGKLARIALGSLVLVPLGLSDRSSSIAFQLAELVEYKQGIATVRGCTAIEALVCGAAHLPSGCLGTACAAGLAALASYLDAGFDAIGGPQTDFALRGEAPLQDDDGDLQVDRVGTAAAPGTWTTRLTTGGEIILLPGATFTGTREGGN